MEGAHGRMLGRYELIGALGEGAYGTVYEALDRGNGERVALKELQKANAETLPRFKQEFRAVQEVHHPNLVRLHELFEDHGKWVIAMELVEGTDLLTHVYDIESPLSFDEERLRNAFKQLAEGLLALHSAGFVHRDLKPSNVRVTDEGRVVVLDFGLTTSLDPLESTRVTGLGTLAYMAPEQASKHPVGPPADWYAFGVCLYEALTGVLPIDDSSPLDVLLGKLQPLASRPAQLVHGVPTDLDQLCADLLVADPALRPTGRAVRETFSRGSARPAAWGTPEKGSDTFEGREAELQALSKAFEQVAAGSTRMVIVEGESGIGKTALVERFIATMRTGGRDPLVLRSRCYENELLAYKAFDGAVEQLARALGKLDDAECARLLPPRAGLLCRLFPALSVVRALGRAPLVGLAADPSVQRLEAFALLARVLSALGASQPIIIAIDDLQWADGESFRLLQALLAGPHTPRCLVVATVRPAAELERETADAMATLRKLSCVSSQVLRGLPPENARAVARELLGSTIPESWVEVIVRESSGHPLFLTVLTRFAGSDEAHSAAELTLDAAIHARLSKLTPDARAMVETVALLGSPQSASLCGRAAAVPESEVPRLVAELCAQKLLRRRRAGEISCFHDHIRRVALQDMPPKEAAILHGRIAAALADRHSSDPTELARHYHAAGDAERALDAYERAAESAAATLGFDRVAALYSRALELAESLGVARERKVALMVALGHALARGGRSAEAARHFLAAAEQSEGEDRTRLRIAAVQHLLQSAHVEEGMAAARALLAELNLPMPTSTAGTLMRLVWNRTLIGFGGVPEHTAEAPTTVPVRMQLDALWGMAMPVSWLDPLASAVLSTRHLRLASKSGDATHLARALAEEAFARAIQKPLAPEVDVLIARARALCDAKDDPALDVAVAFREGTIATFRWTLPRTRERLEHALRVGTESCPDQPWLLWNVRTALSAAWFPMGEHTRLAACTESWIAEAHDRNDRFALSMIEGLGWGIVRHLMADDPDTVRGALQAALEPWPHEPFSFAHFGELVGITFAELYRGGDRGHRWLQRERPRLSRAFVLSTGFGKATLLMFSGHLYLAACNVASEQEKARLRGEARSCARASRRLQSPFAEVNALSLEAQLAALAGENDAALASARKMQVVSHAAGGHLHATCMQYLEGLLEGGSAGREKREASLTWFEQQGWSNPRRGIAMLCPVIDELEARGR